MKTFIFCLILSAVLYSCSNNVTGPTNTNNSTVVFTQDSVVINSDIPIGTDTNVISYEALYHVMSGVSGSHNYHITFTSETNAIDTNAQVSVGIYTALPDLSNGIIHYDLITEGTNINMSYDSTKTVSRPESSYGIYISFHAAFYNMYHTHKYIKIRNIKIIRD